MYYKFRLFVIMNLIVIPMGIFLIDCLETHKTLDHVIFLSFWGVVMLMIHYYMFRCPICDRYALRLKGTILPKLPGKHCQYCHRPY